MRVDIRDRKALSSLSLLSLRTYLKSRHWVDEGDWGNRASLFSKEHEGRRWEILCPFRDTSADFAEAMAEAIAVLATVENRSQLDVFHDLEGTGADVIHMRSPNGLAKAPLRLLQNAEMLHRRLRLTLVSACRSAARKNQPSLSRQSWARMWHDYLANAQRPPSPAIMQSIIPMTLALARLPRRQLGRRPRGLDGGLHTAPFPRPPTSQLTKLAASPYVLICQSPEPVSGDTLEPFSQVVKEGVSANLCESVAALAQDGRGIEALA